MAMKYDPVTGKWTEVISKKDDRNVPRETPKPVIKEPFTIPARIEDNVTGDRVEGEYKEIEDNVLEGNMAVVPDPSIKAKQTVRVNGLGKYLSGLYHVDIVKHTFSNTGGYTQDITVSRNGFGETVKSGMVQKVPVPVPKPKPKAVVKKPIPKVVPKVSTRSYTMVRGDTLWGISIKYYGTGLQWRKIANANGISDPETYVLQIGRKLIIPS